MFFLGLCFLRLNGYYEEIFSQFDLDQCYCLIGGCEKLRRDGSWDSWEARKKGEFILFLFYEGKKGEFGDRKRELRILY